METVALIAAVGDRVQWVRQRQQVGTHLENFRRTNLAVGDQSLNFAALRGLDEAFEKSEPTARRVLLSFTPRPEDAARLAQAKGLERDEVSLGLLKDYLSAMPERQGWSRIVAILPNYAFTPSDGMGSKLSGVGVFVQPLAGMQYDSLDAPPTEAVGEDVTWGPGEGKEREKTYSTRFIAPFFYFKIVTLNAATLEVLNVQSRREFTKLWDPKAASDDPEKQFTPEQLAKSMEGLIEKSVVRAIAGSGSVTAGPLQQVPPPSSR
jgi:hypothetical protein